MSKRVVGLGLASLRTLEGNISTLVGLTQLTSLELYHTLVSGNIEKLAQLKQLTTLSLGNTKVSGSVEKLARLVRLTDLRLDGNTQVSGNIEKLAQLTKLTWLSLLGTKVGGGVEPLAQLTQLTEFNVEGTHVGGDTRGVCAHCKLIHYDHCQQSMCKPGHQLRQPAQVRHAIRPGVCTLHTLHIRTCMCHCV